MVKAQALSPAGCPRATWPTELFPPHDCLQLPHSAAWAQIRAMQEQLLNRSGAGRGEVVWKLRWRKSTSPGISWKGPLAVCLKHAGLHRTKWLFQNTWVPLHIEAEAEIESKVTPQPDRLRTEEVPHSFHMQVPLFLLSFRLDVMKKFFTGRLVRH